MQQLTGNQYFFKNKKKDNLYNKKRNLHFNERFSAYPIFTEVIFNEPMTHLSLKKETSSFSVFNASA